MHKDSKSDTPEPSVDSAPKQGPTVVDTKTVVNPDNQKVKLEHTSVKVKPAEPLAPPPPKEPAQILEAEPVAPTAIPSAPKKELPEATKSPTPLVKATAEASNVTTKRATKEEAEEHLKEVKKYYKSFSGKKGYNPHFHLQKVVTPLEEALNSPGADEQSVINKVMALKKEEDKAKVGAPIHNVGQVDLTSGFKHLPKEKRQ